MAAGPRPRPRYPNIEGFDYINGKAPGLGNTGQQERSVPSKAKIRAYALQKKKRKKGRAPGLRPREESGHLKEALGTEGVFSPRPRFSRGSSPSPGPLGGLRRRGR